MSKNGDVFETRSIQLPKLKSRREKELNTIHLCLVVSENHRRRKREVRAKSRWYVSYVTCDAIT
ncbi:hypothetical protein PUN28_004774 [Cardiocondyla obscurior]|uniref:Uncharacterized protein n=1 Tax=Cardiocondyla obscurior TaxID=286306 RepID=A0AAW2GGF6_9HYME